MMMHFQTEEINVSFTGLYNCICFAELDSSSAAWETTPAVDTESVVTVITEKHVKPRPSSPLAGQVHTSETETQMQKTRSKQTAGEIFSQYNKEVLKLLF